MVNFCQILITIGVMFCLQNREDIKKTPTKCWRYLTCLWLLNDKKRLINHQAQPFFLFDRD